MYYTDAYEEAGEISVHLTVQNNNFNAQDYEISGKWAEEP
jgi:hypothetical protein